MLKEAPTIEKHGLEITFMTSNSPNFLGVDIWAKSGKLPSAEELVEAFREALFIAGYSEHGKHEGDLH